MYSHLCLAFLCIFTLPVLLSACHWIKDLIVEVRDIEDNEFGTTINGCIGKTSFDGRKIVSVYVHNQNIGNLGEDSVTNLDELTFLHFVGCKIDSISTGAFKNLPKISSFDLSRGNTKEIPRNVFNVLPSIDLLGINNNEIDLIEEQAFANLSSLKDLYANNNKLEYWNRNWFANNTALAFLNFKNNRIRAIPRRAFANLPKLKRIILDKNEISVINPDAFLDLTNLDYLGLSYNRLTQIREDISPNKLKILSFRINGNYLNFLPEGLLQKISVEDIVITNNPWRCPCLDRIHSWLYRTNGTINTLWFLETCKGPNIPVCVIPTTFSRTCLELVDPDLTERYINSLKNIMPSEMCDRSGE